MSIRVGYIPYLNMVPFHQNFGPGPTEIDGRYTEFCTLSPRAMGLEAEKGLLDAGAMSLVDWFRLSSRYEPLGHFGIGVKRSAQSVTLFSRVAMRYLEGTIAVSDETSTSFRLLQTILENRYKQSSIRYGRIASSTLFDGSADGLLLIGDEALRAKKEGIKGLPVVTDLGDEWYQWQKCPFVFARWVVRQGLHQSTKDALETTLEASLRHMETDPTVAQREGEKRRLPAGDVAAYWSGFVYRLTPEHQRSIQQFEELASYSHV